MLDNVINNQDSFCWRVRADTPNGSSYFSIISLQEVRTLMKVMPNIVNKDAKGLVFKYMMPFALYKYKDVKIKAIYLQRIDE